MSYINTLNLVQLMEKKLHFHLLMVFFFFVFMQQSQTQNIEWEFRLDTFLNRNEASFFANVNVTVTDKDEILMFGNDYDRNSYFLSVLNLAGEIVSFQSDFIKCKGQRCYEPIHVIKNESEEFLFINNIGEVYLSNSDFSSINFEKFIDGDSIINQFKVFKMIGQKDENLIFSENNSVYFLDINSYEVVDFLIDTMALNQHKLHKRSYLNDGTYFELYTDDEYVNVRDSLGSILYINISSSVLKYFDINNRLIWSKDYNYKYNLRDMTVSNMDIYISGHQCSTDTINCSHFIAQINVDGDSIWQTNSLFSNNIVANEHSIYSFGNLHFLGSYGTLSKYNRSGSLIWNLSENKYPSNMAFTKTGDEVLIRINSPDYAYEEYITKLGTTVSTIDQVNSDIVVFPNPSLEFLNLKNLKSGEQYFVYDINTHLIYKGIPGKSELLNIAHWSSGLYFIRQGDFVFPFIKK